MKAEQRGEIVIYKAGDGQTAIDVRLQDETVWLSLNQIATLFQRDKSVISRHMRNIFQQKELSRNSTVAKFATVQKEGSREISRDIEYYNLDVIISTGYRVNSKRGTQFRIWATNVLREHLVKGFTLNEKRLKENKQRLKELESAVELIEKAKSTNVLTASETAGLLTVITEYTRSWLLLHQYDEGTLGTQRPHRPARFRITEDEAKKAIGHLRKNLMERKEAGELFGKERERGVLKGILGTLEQTFAGSELYPGIEDKAGPPLVFHHQGSSLYRREQTRRIAPLYLVSRKERGLVESGWGAEY